MKEIKGLKEFFGRQSRTNKKGPKETLKLNLVLKVGDHNSDFRIPSLGWAFTPSPGTVPNNKAC